MENFKHYSLDEYFKNSLLYSRADWGARKPKSKVSNRTPVIYLVFKRTDTDGCDGKEECMKIVRNIQKQDMDENDLPDIQYNFLIGGDGTIYEGRGWHVAPEPFPVNRLDLLANLSSRSVLIGLIGDSEEKRPAHKQELSVLHLVGIGAEKDLVHENAQYLYYDEVAYKRDPYDDD